MRIFYHGAHGRDDVQAASPVEADESEARAVLARLGPSGSFLGVLLSQGRTLQLYFNPDATIHAEVLKEEELDIRSTTVTVPLAELLLEAAYRNEDFERKIGFSRVTWHDEKLKRA